MKNTFKNLSPELLENHLCNFLISSWSYSKVTAFARNPAAFEMNYLYGVYGKSSSASVAGKAYHKALDYFFNKKKEGIEVDLVELEASAFALIDEQPANYWKLQKTTPTIEEAISKATESASKLLRNFIGEINTYMDDIDEIIDVEVYCDEWITVNGVEIPLPCHARIDLVVKTKKGRVAVVDHKSKDKFSNDEELALDIGAQAITYAKVYEEKTGIVVDEVWFIENKISKNKTGEPQLNSFKVDLDTNTRMLYELILYSPLRAMISAVNDENFDFVINPSDNYVNKAELWDHWCRTRISEVGVDDFNIEQSKKDIIGKRLKKIRDSSVEMLPPQVIKKFQENAASFITYDLSNKNMTHEEKIEHVLRSFGTIVKVAHKFSGYSSNTFLLEVSAGVPVKSIHSRRLDIANALDVANVRISNEMVVHEGKSYVAVDFSKKREGNLMFDESALQGYRIPLGRDNFQDLIVWDLDNHSTPHALVCGATGSGKSVLIKNTIEYAKMAGINDIIIFDPKYEFMNYADENIVVVNDIIEIEEYMQQLVNHMNDLVKFGRKKMTLVIFDEFADAVANSRKGAELKVYEQVFDGFYANGGTKQKRQLVGELKSLEENLKVLLQKGRSSGFRIMAATQRASVKVITGDAKVNFPVQICFRVPKEADSRVVLDEPGAESLAGMGDGLIKSPEYKETVRFQAFYKPANAMA